MAIKIHSDRCVGLDFGTTNSVLASVNFENRTINTPVRPISRRVGLNISEARELLRLTYLKPLRDAEAELSPG